MSQRRMFSNRIANSAKFLQMPAESQLLYFHLNLKADDDGIAEAYPVIKLLGIAPDSFKVLLAKGYIEQLNEDQVVVITDWLEHNTIRADRKVDSIYRDLLPQRIKTIEPKPRSDVSDNSKRVGGQSTDGVGKVRLGKVRLGKVKNTTALRAGDPIGEFVYLFKEINPTVGILYGRTSQREAVERLLKLHPVKWWEAFMVKYAVQLGKDKFCPRATTPIQMEAKLGAIMAYASSLKTNSKMIDV